MKNISKNKGFTLIELLVVIAIIGILSAIVMTNLQGARAKSRDAKRISDIAQLQLALEQYFDKYQAYPSTIYDNSAFSPAYISTPPKDPSTSSAYNYCLFGNYDYILHATFELSNSAILDGISGYTCGAPCSNAAGSKSYCMGPK